MCTCLLANPYGDIDVTQMVQTAGGKIRLHLRLVESRDSEMSGTWSFPF